MTWKDVYHNLLIEDHKRDTYYNPFLKKWINTFLEKLKGGNSLAVQWLRLCSFTAEVPGSIPGRRTQIPQMRGAAKKNPETKRLGHRFHSVFLWVVGLWMIFHFCFSVFSKLPIINMLCFCHKKKNWYLVSQGNRNKSKNKQMGPNQT